MDIFIPRTYIDKNTNDRLTFDEVVLKNKISIILGEPASGKTYQLEQYDKENENTQLVLLLDIEDEDKITEDIDIVLFDSIDEALSKNDRDRILIKKLLKYINSSLKINPNVKFVITCRYVEWKEVFEKELQKIDKELKIYYIEEISIDDINNLLDTYQVDKELFWNFIKENYLEQLLKNIMMIIHLIEDFDKYKGQKLKYSEIYEKIITSHLTIKTNNERDKKFKKLNQKEILKISSIVASYMVLNKLETINTEQINQLSTELFQLSNVEITGEKLELLFDTALFKGTREKVSFFHKSIKEYLCAYFINIKRLDIKTIKDIFAHKEGFYEEFEEVIIYLTNMEERFFSHFVEFDPFIFRRHPYLNVSEQKTLLIFLLKTLQVDKQKVWNKWEYIENSTLTHINLDELDKILRSNIDIENCDKELFNYLLSLLEFNYSIELENIIFEVLETKKDDINLCTEFMRIHKIYNFQYNKRLYEFIKSNNLILSSEDYLYNHIFNVLYKEIEFKDLIPLIENFKSYDSHLIERISIEDIVFWLNGIINSFDKKTNDKYSDEQLGLLIFIVLKNFNKLEDKNILIKIIEFIDDRAIHLDFFVRKDEKYQNVLEFHDIKEVFWKYYFNPNRDSKYIWGIFDILKFYTFDINYEVKELIKVYKIEKYLDHYLYIRNWLQVDESILLENQSFQRYLDEIIEKAKEREKKWLLEDKDWIKKRENKKEQEKLRYEDALASLSSSDNMYIIYDYLDRKEGDDIHIKIVEELKGDYLKFINLIKQEFINDKLYLDIKSEIYRSSVYVKSIVFNYMFSNISKREIEDLINTKEEYKKLFFHCTSYQKISEKYFITISQNYKKELIDLLIYTFKATLKQSKYKNTNFDYYTKATCKILDIYNKNDLSELIREIKSIDNKSFMKIEHNDKSYLLNILSLDKENYGFIKNKSKLDEDRLSLYYESLLKIDFNFAINDFISEYLNENGLNIENYKYDKFDNINVPVHKIKAFKILMGILYDYDDRKREYKYLQKLNYENKKFILEKYFEYFLEYHRFSYRDIDTQYDDMEHLIGNIFQGFENNIDDIDLLIELKNSENERLKSQVKYRLEIIYNLRLKNREFNNEYYKNIFNSFVEEQDSRFFDYEKLINDLIDICLLETENRKTLFNLGEDEINDRFRTDLLVKGYNVADQSRGGESESSKSVGERDIIIRNKISGITETVIEAFNLESLDKTVIEKHYEKLINKYDTTGNKQNYILVYSKAKNFNDLWNKYKDEYIITPLENINKENLKIGYTKEGNMKVIHLFINFYCSSGDLMK